MKTEYFSGSLDELQADALLVEVYRDFRLPEAFKGAFKKAALFIEERLSCLEKKPDNFEVFYFPFPEGGFKFVLLSCLESPDADGVRTAASKLLNKAEALGLKRVALFPVGHDALGEEAVYYTVEGALLGAYSFSKYKDGASKGLDEVVFVGFSEEGRKLYERALTVSGAVNYVRDLVNEPANVITPSVMAEKALELAEGLALEVEVFDEKRIAGLQMAGILAVGGGSKNPPRFVHVSYKPAEPLKRVVLVGKGVTFDSGGLSLKPEQFMRGMKSDKSGACAVLGVLKAVAELGLPVEVHGLIPLVENMPDGGSYRPDDVIVFRNGKSVEVKSTDAEGRLILADALIYASGLSPDVVIDVATLTGACVVALGRYTSGLFTDDDELAGRLLEACARTGEKLWRLPLDEDLMKDIKGDFTHLRNVGKTRYGGAITAALFLKKFAPPDASWAHIDIAGPAYLEESWKYYSKGATGQPVRTLVEFLSRVVS
ncbi:MAG: leucyl aminopeptidase [Deferribacteres bacterium]|nr:leucyl aminopeptidase [Deferribacteres bacterium]